MCDSVGFRCRCRRRIMCVLSARVPNIIDGGGGGDGAVSDPLLTSRILVPLSVVLAVRCIVAVCVASTEVLLRDAVRRRIVERGPRSRFKIFSVRAREMPHVTSPPHPTNAVPLLYRIRTAIMRALTHARAGEPLIF